MYLNNIIFSVLFQVYDGLYAIAVRDFGKAAKLFLETVSTFTSYELMDYTQFVKVSYMFLSLLTIHVFARARLFSFILTR